MPGLSNLCPGLSNYAIGAGPTQPPRPVKLCYWSWTNPASLAMMTPVIKLLRLKLHLYTNLRYIFWFAGLWVGMRSISWRVNIDFAPKYQIQKLSRMTRSTKKIMVKKISNFFQKKVFLFFLKFEGVDDGPTCVDDGIRVNKGLPSSLRFSVTRGNKGE